MHAGGGTYNRGEKRNVLIVSVLLLIGSNLTLRSNMQGSIEVMVCEKKTWLDDPNLSWAMLRSKTKLRLPA